MYLCNARFKRRNAIGTRQYMEEMHGLQVHTHQDHWLPTPQRQK
jgi:hypothetical protein